MSAIWYDRMHLCLHITGIKCHKNQCGVLVYTCTVLSPCRNGLHRCLYSLLPRGRCPWGRGRCSRSPWGQCWHVLQQHGFRVGAFSTAGRPAVRQSLSYNPQHSHISLTRDGQRSAAFGGRCQADTSHTSNGPHRQHAAWQPIQSEWLPSSCHQGRLGNAPIGAPAPAAAC